MDIRYGYILCLLDPPISDRWMLKCPTVIVDLSINSYSSVSFCFMSFDALVNCIHFEIVTSFWRMDFIMIHCPSLWMISFLDLNYVMSEVNISYFCLYLSCVSMIHFSPTIYFYSICIFIFKVSFWYTR